MTDLLARLRRDWFFLLSAAATLGAGVGLVVLAPHLTTPVDRALPLLLLATLVASQVARAGPLAGLLVAGPLLIVLIAIAMTSERMRLAGFGAVVALTILGAIIQRSRDNRIELGPAIALAATAGVLLRFIPWQPSMAVQGAIVLAGVVLLVVTLSRSGKISLVALSGIIAVAAAAPDVPWRVALFPLHLALMLLAKQRRTPFWIIASGAVAMVAGRWAMLQWAIVAVLEAVVVGGGFGVRQPQLPLLVPTEEATGSGKQEIGEVTLKAAAAAAALQSRPPANPLFAAAALLVIGFFLRPALGLIYFLSAAIFALATDSRDSGGRQWPDIPMSGVDVGATDRVPAEHWNVRPLTGPALVLTFILIALFPWSGIVTARFPLPIPIVLLGVIVAMLSLPALSWRIGALASVALLLVGWTLLPPVPSQRWPVELSLRPGESLNIHAEQRSRRTRVVLSGAHIADLAPGTVVAKIETIDRQARAYRRDVVIGEIADWGAFRRSMVFFTRNPFPSQTLGPVSGYGREAWLRGSGSITVETASPIALLRITADHRLPEPGRLQIEAVEYGGP